MINKIIFTKTISSHNSQLEFCLPTGYKVYSPFSLTLSPNLITTLDLGVLLYSESPITLLYTLLPLLPLCSIVDSCQVVAPKQSTSLSLSLLSTQPLTLDPLFPIANLVVLQTSFIDLFEVNSSVFKQYV